MTVAEIIEQLEEMTDGEAILYPNYEEALVGICIQFGRPPVALYDRDKCIEILMMDMKEHDPEEAYEMAVEHFEFNTLGCWAGEYTPAFTVGQRQ